MLIFGTSLQVVMETKSFLKSNYDMKDLGGIGDSKISRMLNVTPQKYPRIFIIILLYIPSMN